MKRTHKFRGLSDVDAVVAAAPSLAVAAKRLGVDRSTLHRWMVSGKVQKRGETAAKPAEVPADASTWAATVTSTFDLSATELQLLGLADRALQAAQDVKESPTTRLMAMGRFQALVKQLDLSDAKLKATGEKQTERKLAAVLPMRRAAGVDPRAALMGGK